MLPDQVSNPGPLTYESGALLIALRGPALSFSFQWENQDEFKVGRFDYYWKIKEGG